MSLGHEDGPTSFPDRRWRNWLHSAVEVPAACRLLGLGSGGRALELGCGRGVAVAPLASRLDPAVLLGVDRCVDVLGAPGRGDRASTVNSTVVCGDICSLPIASETINTIVDFGTCYH